MVHENSLGNLKQGNTKNVGRKPGKMLKTILEEMLNKQIAIEDIDGITKKMTTREAIALRLINDAFTDEDPNIRHRAAKQIFEHTDPIDNKLDITTDGEPIVHKKTIEILFREPPNKVSESDGDQSGV